MIAAGRDQGLTFTSSLVYAVRGAKAGKAAPKKTREEDLHREEGHGLEGRSPLEVRSASGNLPLTLSAKEVVAAGSRQHQIDDHDMTEERSAGRPRRKSAGTKPVGKNVAAEDRDPTSIQDDGRP